MNRLVWIMLYILSLIVSIIFNFNSPSLVGLIIFSLFLSLIIFGILILVVKSIQSVKEKKYKKAILFAVISIITIVILSFGYFMFPSGFCLTAITPAHFRTNILTGQCDFGGYNPCVSNDPWYYKQECDLSQEKLIDVLKESNRYEFQVNDCNRYCQTGSEQIFCDEVVHLWRGMLSNKVRCDYLVECDNITCS